MKHFLIAGLAGCCALTASAESSYSVEFNKTSYEDALLEAQPNSLSFAYHYRFHKHFSAIGKIGTGVYEDNVDALGNDPKLSIDYMLGAYVKADIMPDSDFNIYGTLGYTRVSLDLNANVGSFSESENDLSYGLGLDYKMSESARLYVEGVQLIDDESVDMTTYNLGVQFNF